MHNDQCHHTPSKSEPVQAVLDEGCGGANLNGVSVVGRVLKEPVIRVEDLSREKEEEFSTGASIIEPEKCRNDKSK